MLLRMLTLQKKERRNETNETSEVYACMYVCKMCLRCDVWISLCAPRHQVSRWKLPRRHLCGTFGRFGTKSSSKCFPAPERIESQSHASRPWQPCHSEKKANMAEKTTEMKRKTTVRLQIQTHKTSKTNSLAGGRLPHCFPKLPQPIK